MNALVYAQLVLDLFTTLAAQARAYRDVIQTARNEGRDITNEELAALKSARDKALADLQQQANS